MMGKRWIRQAMLVLAVGGWLPLARGEGPTACGGGPAIEFKGEYVPSPPAPVTFDPTPPPSPCPFGYYSPLTYWAPMLQSWREHHWGTTVSVHPVPLNWVPAPGFPPVPFYFNGNSLNLVDNPQDAANPSGAGRSDAGAADRTPPTPPK